MKEGLFTPDMSADDPHSLIIVLDVPPHQLLFPIEHLKCVYCADGVRSLKKKKRSDLCSFFFFSF